MPITQPHRIRTISEYHQFRSLPKPQHPLISVVHFEDIKRRRDDEPISIVNDFYSIALKRSSNTRMKYGQTEYDFTEGVLLFISPGQVYSIEGSDEFKHSGWMIIVHPDFLWNTSLAKNMRQFEFFGYSINEALHLSDKEESLLNGIVDNMEQEYLANIDHFSQDVMIAQLELLLTYSERFYHRQFLTRRIANHGILDRLEKILEDHFEKDELVSKGLPTVQSIATQLNVSPNYLSGLLKVLTGQSTQQHIHDKLIEKAKQQLSTTALSVSEIAYELGFEHPQSFSKLFKSKVNVTPVEYRESFS